MDDESHTHTDNTRITLSARGLCDRAGFGYVCLLGRWVHLDRGRWGWRWRVLEGLEVVYDVVSDQRAAAECPPVNDGDGERRVEVLVFWQLLKDNRLAMKH